MSPASRRNGILAGLALASLVALGFADRSRNEWVRRWQLEAEARVGREADLVAQACAHDTETSAMKQRVALLQSDLACERELREGADARAMAAAQAGTELEAAKAELARAYGKIDEIEQAGGTVRIARLNRQISTDYQTALLPDEKGEKQVEWKRCGGIEVRRLQEAILKGTTRGPSKKAFKGGDTDILEEPTGCGGFASDGAQHFDGGLNQGVDYVEPDAEVTELKNLKEIDSAVPAIKAQIEFLVSPE